MTREGSFSSSRIGIGLVCMFVVLSYVGAAGAAVVQWRIEDGGNGHYYEAIAEPSRLSWTEANAIAAQQGGNLATLTSAEENEFVFSLIDEPSFWYDYWWGSAGPMLGGYQLEGSEEPDEGWSWVSGEDFVYESWDSDQPNNEYHDGYEDVLYYGTLFDAERQPLWHDYQHDHIQSLSYVIEYVPEPATLFYATLGLLALCRPRNGRQRVSGGIIAGQALARQRGLGSRK